MSFEKTVSNTPEALQIQQMQEELWLERCLNQLHSRLDESLACSPAIEAKIFQTFVAHLGTALETSYVALAFADATTSADVSSSKQTFRICYVASTPQVQVEKTKQSTQSSSLKLIGWRLGEVITLDDLHHLQSQKSAWQCDRYQSVSAWLIAPIAPLLPSNSQPVHAYLKIHYRQQLVERSLTILATSIGHLKRSQQCQQLEVCNQELVRINLLKNEFLANTSHEIRTPLSSILGFTHLLLAQGYNADCLRHHEYLNIILTSGQHLLALINDILDLSKIEANQLEVQPELVDVPALCRSVIALVKEKASNKGLELRLDLDPSVKTLSADSLRLKQMLFNLLSNALKFTAQGKVGLQVRQKGMFLRFTVWDTGTGISPEEQIKLFQPYCQIANTTASYQEGTGLGLALTQRLAALHGGWIEVLSELHKGSQFTIVIPLLVALAEETASSGKLEQKFSSLKTPSVSEKAHRETWFSPSAKILLVEDEPYNAKLVITYLKKLGHQLTWVHNAAQLWQALQKTQPDIILMDIHLPDVDGLSLLQQLQAQEQYREIPVIAQTAMAMKGDRETCLCAGATDYISKPIDLEVLAGLVSKYSPSKD